MTQFPIPKSKESYGGSQSPTFSTCLFPGFYSPSVADIIRLIKLPTHQTPISQWSTPRRKSFLYGIMIMASWQGIMWIWNSTFAPRIDMYPNSLTIYPRAFFRTDKTHSNPTCKITPKTKLKKIPKQQAQDRFKKAEACKTGPIPR